MWAKVGFVGALFGRLFHFFGCVCQARSVAISSILEAESIVVDKVNSVRARKRIATLDASPSQKKKRVKTATEN